MSSVNNFYDIFNSHYGHPKKNNTVWSFSPHGSKNWLDLRLLFSKEREYLQYGAIIMHDQEPFFIDSLQELKDNLIEDKGYPENTHSWAHLRKTSLRTDLIEMLPAEESALMFIRSSEVPIICHSEKNSDDIQKISSHMIPCYYWWHGLIARDWFRHWRYHPDLVLTNKSAAASRFLFYCRATDGTRQYRKDIKSELSCVSIATSSDKAPPTLSAYISVEDANSTAIHIVAETLFETNKIYLTEKVFKPMVMLQPFVLFAAPGSLQYLRDYGFKTFDHIWSEDYDLIQCHSDRKQEVIDLIKKLNQLSESEFYEMYQQALPVINFNRQHFFSDYFQEILWKELSDNMEVALSKQRECRKSMPGGTDLYYYNKYVELFGKQWPNADLSVTELINHGTIKQEQVVKHYPALVPLLKQN